MKGFAIVGAVVSMLFGATVIRAQEAPKMPTPQKEHEWLKQFVGEWESESECVMEPGKPPVKAKGTESARLLGGFWVIGEGKTEMMGMKFSSVLTVGYDPAKKKYVGTWVDSLTDYMWRYEGTLDATGKILTLNTEGPTHTAPGKMAKYREVIEFKNKDHRVFSSSVQGEDGKWTTFVTINSKRKK